MSIDPNAVEEPRPPIPESWPALNRNERRALGVLIEKAKTTPDAYPLTLNSLVTGCNQKSNRDPVMNLEPADVEEAVDGLKKHGYIQQISGSGRTDKIRHVLYDAWKVDKVQLAILGELLLRGAQTEGELRGRAGRMEPIADLDELRTQLRGLAERKLVIPLTPEGRRGATVTHGFLAPDEVERLRIHGAESTVSGESPSPRGDGQRGSNGELAERVSKLESELRELRQAFEQFRDSPTAAGDPS